MEADGGMRKQLEKLLENSNEYLLSDVLIERMAERAVGRVTA